MTRFGALLRSYRLACNGSLRWLAGEVDIGLSQLERIERDALAPPSRERIAELGRALDLTPEEQAALTQAAATAEAPATPDDPALIQVLSRGSILPKETP